jgi:guanine deaminase
MLYSSSSSEPCPTCLTVCYWAQASRLVFGATNYDVATYGFEDVQLYREPAVDVEHHSLPEVSAGGTLRGWADNFPEPVTPKY